MSKNWTEVHDEVFVEIESSARLCFQWCTYHYEDPGLQPAGTYRFIWRDPTGRQMAHRGQARIPDAQTLYQLLRKAKEAGWLPNEEDWANADAGAGYDGGVLSQEDY